MPKMTIPSQQKTLSELFKLILKPERAYYIVALIYGVATSVLMLALPISVQALINTVVNTKMEYFIYVLAFVLFSILALTAILLACREYVMELFQRRFFVRITAEAMMSLVYSDQNHVQKINRTELVNKFFEVMHIQKIVPSLLTHGFSILLQMSVGLVVVSFYHPFLLVFSLVFLLGIYIVWKIWSSSAIKASLKLSEAKYDLVNWMEEVARANHFFKSDRAIGQVLKKTNHKTEGYIKNKKRFFKESFSQSLAFLSFFCIANATLLGLGGVLVARGQLSIGQLIGAELIMSAIFYNLVRIGSYTRMFYELCASIDKLGYFFRLPSEQTKGKLVLDSNDFDVEFDKVKINYRNHLFHFDMQIPFGEKILVKCAEPSASKVFSDLLRGYTEPEQGRVLLQRENIHDFDMYRLRENMMVLDNYLVVEGTIREFFQYANPDITTAQIEDLLQLVGLHETVRAMADGLETTLVPSGYPFLPEEIVCLKLAVILAAKPSVLVMTEIFDVLPRQRRHEIIEQLCAVQDMSVVYFSNKKQPEIFDDYLYIGINDTQHFTTVELLQSHEHNDI